MIDARNAKNAAHQKKKENPLWFRIVKCPRFYDLLSHDLGRE